MNLVDRFKLGDEKEDFQTVSANILNGIDFKGTNLWILIFAIFIASLGLNVNSTAVIIGAMLVSPIMGPIIGVGYGMAINDLQLLRKSFSSYLFAAAIGLTTSAVYFLVSPINDAHSEILARTAPNIYDVLIALFGGFAGILAMSSKLKGNVIPGVAIATALMPPLCTAGYGLATLQLSFFFGAIYLFLINTVFIALATLLTTRILKHPFKQLPHPKDEIKSRRIVIGIVTVTLLPSIYLGFDMVRQNKYQYNANQFIENEVLFSNDYLLKKSINPKNKTISLTYGGPKIEEREIALLKKKLPKYHLEKTTLEILQSFAGLYDDKSHLQTGQLGLALADKDRRIANLQQQMDSLNQADRIDEQLYKELRVQYPHIEYCLVKQTAEKNKETGQRQWTAVLKSNTSWQTSDKTAIEKWMRIRLNNDQIKIHFEQ